VSDCETLHLGKEQILGYVQLEGGNYSSSMRENEIFLKLHTTSSRSSRGRVMKGTRFSRGEGGGQSPKVAVAESGVGRAYPARPAAGKTYTRKWAYGKKKGPRATPTHSQDREELGGMSIFDSKEPYVLGCFSVRATSSGNTPTRSR